MYAVAFDFVALEDLDDEGDEDLTFFRFGFLGTLGSSLRGRSLNMSEDGWCPIECSKSVTKDYRNKSKREVKVSSSIMESATI